MQDHTRFLSVQYLRAAHTICIIFKHSSNDTSLTVFMSNWTTRHKPVALMLSYNYETSRSLM